MKLMNRKEFIKRSLGFGSFKAPFVFIGLEPGMGKQERDRLNANAAKRIAEWRTGVEDLYRYHKRIGVTRWFNSRDTKGKPRLQKTWAKLIRLLLSLKQHELENSATKLERKKIRDYQSERWGRKGKLGETLLLELFPLACPSTKKKDFKKCYGEDRIAYQEQCRPDRIKLLRQTLQKGKRRLVLFYGVTKRKTWQEIAKVEFENSGERLYMKWRKGILYAVVVHPARETNSYFESVGQRIGQALAKGSTK